MLGRVLIALGRTVSHLRMALGMPEMCLLPRFVSGESWLPRACRGNGRAVASGELLPRACCFLGRVVASGESCPMCHATEGAQRLARLMKETYNWLSIRCTANREGWELPTEALTAYRSLGAMKGPPMSLGTVPKHPLSTLQLRTSVTKLLIYYREIWARSWTMTLSFWFVRSLFCLCACYWCVVFLCMSLLPSFLRFDCNHLWRFLTAGYWYKEDNCGTQVWSLDHLRGVECNPWPKKVTTTWSGHWPNNDKNCCVSCLF
jgi:hypothetical protein